MVVYRRLRGMRDYLPEDVKKLNYVKSIVRELFRLFGYKEVMTPTLESFDLLAAKSGEEIRHRMYAFTDLGGRKVALRPEMTASIARFYVNNLRGYSKPIRLGYIANCFRYDEPQYARYREFWQGGFELIGSQLPEADAEIIEIADLLMKKLGFKRYYIKLGHIGILRAILSSELIEESEQNRIFGLMDKGRLSEAIMRLKKLAASPRCVRTISELANLKGYATKDLILKAESIITGYDEAIKHLENLREVLECLKACEVESVILDFGFARGLEYYTGVIFEVFAEGFKLALGGGGRYDRLIELFGGEPTPAVGYAPGLDRIVLAMSELNIPFKFREEIKTYVVPTSNDFKLKLKAIEIAHLLRENDLGVELEVMGRSLRRALSHASARGFTFAIIVGTKEISKGKVVLRDLELNMQYEVTLSEAINIIRNRNKQRLN